jgi:NAD(P)H dehydrogenase (quinone)
MHHGMFWVGVPYTSSAMANTRSGGSPYGASHVAWDNHSPVTDEERTIAAELGERLARVAGACEGL